MSLSVSGFRKGFLGLHRWTIQRIYDIHKVAGGDHLPPSHLLGITADRLAALLKQQDPR
jgi:hypothetical protein